MTIMNTNIINVFLSYIKTHTVYTYCASLRPTSMSGTVTNAIEYMPATFVLAILLTDRQIPPNIPLIKQQLITT